LRLTEHDSYILDLNRIWILKPSVYWIWIGICNYFVGLDLDLKSLNPFIPGDYKIKCLCLVLTEVIAASE